MTSRLGNRGGRTATFDQGAALLSAHKPEQTEAVRRQILLVALRAESVHGDDVDCELAESNVVGAVFNALHRRKLLRPLTWRASTKAASHGRQSRVWALTPLGEQEARKLVGVSGDTFPEGSAGRPSVTADSGALPRRGGSFLPGPVEGPPDYEIAYGPLCPGEGWGLVWVLGSLKRTEPAAYWRRAA